MRPSDPRSSLTLRVTAFSCLACGKYVEVPPEPELAVGSRAWKMRTPNIADMAVEQHWDSVSAMLRQGTLMANIAALVRMESGYKKLNTISIARAIERRQAQCSGG